MTTKTTTRKTPGKELEIYAGPWHIRAWKPRPGMQWDEWTEAVMIAMQAGNSRRILHLLTTLEKDDPDMRATALKPHAWIRYDVPADLIAIALGMATDADEWPTPDWAPPDQVEPDRDEATRDAIKESLPVELRSFVSEPTRQQRRDEAMVETSQLDKLFRP